MHKSLAQEYFEMQLKALERDSRYQVKRVMEFIALVTIRAGAYLPVFRIQADNFDLEPPLFEFANPTTGEKLPDHLWPQNYLESGIASGNTLFPGNILCHTGNRAFHTHCSHFGDSFNKYRNEFTLKRFLDEYARKIENGLLNMSPTGGIYNARN